MQAAATAAKTIDGKMPGYFGDPAAAALRGPRDSGRDRRGDDDGLLRPGLARERPCRHLLCQHFQARPAAALGASGADPARGGAGPSPPDLAPAGGRASALPPLLLLLHRLHRGLGPLCREPGRGDGALRHAREEDGPAFLPGVAGVAAGGRHRNPFEGLGQGPGGRLHAREYGADRRQYRRRGESLHQLAGPGARLQDRRAEDQGAPGEGARKRSARSST